MLDSSVTLLDALRDHLDLVGTKKGCDPERVGLVRVARVVSAIDCGRILNEKLARSQIMGAVVMGIGMTLLEETIFDATGRVANGTFGDYLSERGHP